MTIFFQKLALFFKNHWQLPLTLVVAIVLFVLFRDKGQLVDWFKTLNDAKAQHSSDIKALEDSHAAQIVADNKATARALEVQKQVIEAYVQAEKTIDADTKKRIKQITDDLKHDPKKMAEEIEATTGFKVVILE